MTWQARLHEDMAMLHIAASDGAQDCSRPSLSCNLIGVHALQLGQALEERGVRLQHYASILDCSPKRRRSAGCCSVASTTARGPL